MRKIIVILTVLVMSASMLSMSAGCGGSSGSEKINAESADNSQSNNSNKSDSITDSQDNSSEEEAAKSTELEEAVIVDNEYCTFSIKGLEKDSIWGYSLKLFIENKTDKELMFSMDKVSVNGFMCDPFWGTTVTAGMKANDEASFLNSSLESIGVETPSYFEFELRVYDDNDWSADPFVEDYFSYGNPEEVSTITTDNMQVVFENDTCSMYVAGFDNDNIWGYTMTLYLENKSDNNLMFSADGVAVNGYMCDPFWGTEVVAGKRAIADVSWSDSDFEENDIETVKEITFPVRVYDSDDWSADSYVDDTFTIVP